tara:strand:+ start:3891 stop:4790 length:900 start_codon:yes stop_codon:yes gene_type:complete
LLYDTIKIVKYLDKLPVEALTRVRDTFIWKNCLWKPRFNNFNEVVCYTADLKNLKLRLRGDELTITNSLQKFYMGNNYEPFTYLQAVEAVNTLNTCFGNVLLNAEVKRLAIGTVIYDVPENTFQKWQEYKTIQPQFMCNGTKVYGVHFKATNYKIKGYDKTYQVKQEARIDITENVIRFEIEANSRFINQGKDSVGIYKLSDLTDFSKFQKLGNQLLSVYGKIKKRKHIAFESLTPEQIKLIATYGNPFWANGLKKYHKHTHKKERQAYLKLLIKLNHSENENNIYEKLKTQVNFCLNN